MDNDNNDIFEQLAKAVSDVEVDEVKRLVDCIIEKKLDVALAIEGGIRRGLEILGNRFETGDAFIPELMMAAKSAESSIEVLTAGLVDTSSKKGKFVIGTVRGDVHDLGKNIVAAMLKASGFEVFDLGINVSVENFIGKVKEIKPEILGLSALLLTTISVQKEVIEALVKEGIRNNVKVMVGGVAVTREWAEEIGADAYADNAAEAVRLAKHIVGKSEVLL